MGARDRRALAGGGAVIAVLLIYLLWGGDSDPPKAVASPVAPPRQITAPSPPPAPVPSPAAPADTARPRLVGLLGGGAIFAFADGQQRYVAIGRELQPGLVLIRVEVHHAVLQSPAGEVRLGFDAGEAQAPPPVQAVVPAQSAPVTVNQQPNP